MKPLDVVLGVAMVGIASFGAEVFSASQQTPPPVPAAGAPAPAPAAGRGGRGNPTAQLFNEVCAGCHGATPTAGPRAPSLLADTWLHGGDDEAIARNIRDGFIEKGMPPFSASKMVMDNWEGLYAYLKGRADGQIKPGHLYAIEGGK